MVLSSMVTVTTAPVSSIFPLKSDANCAAYCIVLRPFVRVFLSIPNQVYHSTHRLGVRV